MYRWNGTQRTLILQMLHLALYLRDSDEISEGSTTEPWKAAFKQRNLRLRSVYSEQGNDKETLGPQMSPGNLALNALLDAIRMDRIQRMSLSQRDPTLLGNHLMDSFYTIQEFAPYAKDVNGLVSLP